MPRYRYECAECGELVMVFHGIEETLADCKVCEIPNTMKKLLSKPLHMKKHPQGKKKVGQLTRKYIEENREVLKQQKKDAKEKANESD
jgi:putative FmdB family regulatory protein